MPCRNHTGSNLKKALLAAAVAAFIHVPALDLDARVLSGSVTERKQNRKIESMLKSARKNYDSGKVQPALDTYWKILELDPNETFAYLELGEIYVNLRIYDRAIELLEPGLNLAQREMDRDTICYYFCILTNAHLGLNQTGLANKALIKAAEASPKNPMPRKVMGDIYLANERVADAIKAYRKAVELDPTYQPAVEKLGELTAKYGDQIPTRSVSKRAIKEKAVQLPASENKPQNSPKAVPAKPVNTAAADTPSSADSEPARQTSPQPAPDEESIAGILDEPQIQLPAAALSTPPSPGGQPAKPAKDAIKASENDNQTIITRPVPTPIAVSPETAVTTVQPPPKPGPDDNAVAAVSAGSSTVEISSSADPGEIESQLDKLLAGSPEEKSAAVSFFVKLEEKGLTEIEELLYDPDPEVRSLAVRTLPEFKAFSQRVKTMLQDASADPDPLVIEEINRALESL